MGKFFTLLSVLRKGSELANAEQWKSGAIQASAVIAFLSAVVAAARAFGYQLPVSDAQLADIANGIVAVACVVGSLLTAATSKRVGIPGLAPHPAPADDSAERVPVPAVAVQRVEAARGCDVGRAAHPAEQTVAPAAVATDQPAVQRRDARVLRPEGAITVEYHGPGFNPSDPFADHGS